MNKEENKRIKGEIRIMNNEEKITISVNEEDIQNIINAYEKDIEYINQLEKENKKYKEVIDEAIEFTNKNWGTWCTHHLEYMTELQDILKEV